MKKSILIFLKILISVGFLYFVFAHFDGQKIKNALLHLDPVYFFLALCFNVISIAFSGKRFHEWIPTAPIHSFRLTYLASFLSQILPGSLSGDAYRAYALKKHTLSLKEALKILFCDRAVGLFTLFFLGSLASIFTKLNVFIFNFSIVCGALIFFFINHKIKFLLCFFQKKIFILSLLSGIFYLFSAWLVSLSIPISISCLDVFSFFPIIILSISLPISFAGWGVRETAMVFILRDFNISPEKAISFSVAFGVMVLISTIPALLCLRKEKS